MKRYFSGAVLLGTLAALLAVWLATAPRPGGPASYAPRTSGESALFRVEDGALQVNINAADAETLRLLSGVGETLSALIVDYREGVGPFGSVEALKNVRGIGEGKLNAIRDRIFCGPAG